MPKDDSNYFDFVKTLGMLGRKLFPVTPICDALEKDMAEADRLNPLTRVFDEATGNASRSASADFQPTLSRNGSTLVTRYYDENGSLVEIERTAGGILRYLANGEVIAESRDVADSSPQEDSAPLSKPQPAINALRPSIIQDGEQPTVRKLRIRKR